MAATRTGLNEVPKDLSVLSPSFINFLWIAFAMQMIQTADPSTSLLRSG